jgi:hypothetical protein
VAISIARVPISLRGNLLDNYLSSSKLTLVSDFEATFFRGENISSCLDGCIVSENLANHCATTLLSPIGPGHLPFIISLDIAIDRALETGRETRNHKQDDNFTDWMVFFKSLKQQLPTSTRFSTLEDINKFTLAIQQAQSAALTAKPSRQVNEGWWNDRCREAVRKRNSALRKLQKCFFNSPHKKILKENYILARDNAKEIIKNEIKRWKEWLINGVKNSPHRRIWNLITRLCGSKFKVVKKR